MAWMRATCLALAVVFLGLGVCLPIIRLDRLYFFSETPSLAEIVTSLFEQGDAGLALVVGLFSIVFPIMKLSSLALQLISPSGEGGWFRRAMSYLSRWSMMDVMLVAIVIFAAKSSGLATAISQPGLWFYGASAILAGVIPSLPRSGGVITRR